VFHTRILLPVVVLVCLTAALSAQDKKGSTEPTLLTATGVVEKADKDTLTVKPRGADGKFQKAVSMKVTGTSKVTILAPQKRADKVVMTQRDIEVKDLVTGQTIAVIYAEVGKDGAVLLSGVAHPAPEK